MEAPGGVEPPTCGLGNGFTDVVLIGVSHLHADEVLSFGGMCDELGRSVHQFVHHFVHQKNKNIHRDSMFLVQKIV
jgi:hypothetical protein